MPADLRSLVQDLYRVFALVRAAASPSTVFSRTSTRRAETEKRFVEPTETDGWRKWLVSVHVGKGNEGESRSKQPQVQHEKKKKKRRSFHLGLFKIAPSCGPDALPADLLTEYLLLTLQQPTRSDDFHPQQSSKKRQDRWQDTFPITISHHFMLHMKSGGCLRWQFFCIIPKAWISRVPLLQMCYNNWRNTDRAPLQTRPLCLEIKKELVQRGWCLFAHCLRGKILNW